MDIKKPVYHFRPAKNWINDPNGTVKIGEYYHIFYQYNPTGPKWGNLHWGHARTKDFVNYEVLPMMLQPQKEIGENDCYSGCAAVNKDGNPVIIYTSVKDSDTPNIQKSVVCDKELVDVSAKRCDSITVDMDGLAKIRNDWRDPYVFTCQGRYYLVLAAAIEENQIPSVLLFESPSGDLVNWKFVRVFQRFHPIFELMECPNFFRSHSGKWLLLGSPYAEVQYRLGTLDEEKMEFTEEKCGFVDYCSHFYATNTIEDGDRTLIFAFCRGWTSEDRDWNNVISLPRTICCNENDEVIQLPIAEIEALRGELITDRSNEVLTFPSFLNIEDRRFIESEIDFTVEVQDEEILNLVTKNTPHLLSQIMFASDHVKFDSIYIPLSGRCKYNVRLFIDHTMMEIFIDDGRHCATRIIERLSDITSIEFRGDGKVTGFKAWHMKSLVIDEL